MIEYWHIMLVFGVLCGSCTCLIFSPSIAAIGHWFKARRGFATGVSTTGGAIGGIIFPLMMQYLIPQVGWAWTVRILGFVCLFLLTIGCCLVRTRLPPDHNATAKPDFGILREPTFAFTVAAIYLLEWALFVPLTYISSYALHEGFKESFSYQALIILNIGSVVGRWLPGFYADKIGAFNTMIATTVLSAVTVLAVWLPAGHTMPGLIIFCLLFGFASGSNIGLTPVCVGKLCRTENLGRYYATCYTIVSIGCLTGIPIVGEIIKANGGEYWGLITFTGVCYVGGLAAFVIVRVLKVGWRLKAIY
jgi:MFS family permease